MPSVVVVERDYRTLYKRYTSVGPLLDKLGNGGKGISWNTQHEVDLLAKLNGKVGEPGTSEGRPRIDTDIDATEVILSLAPETNGEVAVKAWAALSKVHGRDHTHLAIRRKTRRSVTAISSHSRARSSPRPPGRAWNPESVCYKCGLHQRSHELIPWRTLTPAVNSLHQGSPVDARIRRRLLASTALRSIRASSARPFALLRRMDIGRIWC